MIARPGKVFILDGIGGVPLGREIDETFRALDVKTAYLDCLKQQRRPFHAIRSAYAKARKKSDDRDGFYFFPRLREQALRALLEAERPSHLLVIGFVYKFYDPRFLRRLASELGIGLFLYDTDSCNLYSRRREFIFFIENELPIYDRIFSFSKVTTRFFRETRGLDAVHLPFGAMPINTRPSTKDIDVLFVGSCDLRRIFLLEGIRDHVAVYGSRWQRNYPLISDALRSHVVDKPVWGEDLHRLLSGSKIVLNITRSDFFGTETGVNLRIFEALAAGCFLLTDHCDEIAESFRPGIDIETYRSRDELIEKCAYFLENDEHRRRIARSGHERFLSSHTWYARIEQLVRHIQGE